MDKQWRLVPTEHTIDMSIAFAEAWYSKPRCIDDHDLQDVWAAILAAAPQPPSASDERELFEAWVSASGRSHQLVKDDRHGWYRDLTVAAWWTAWQARAALAPSPMAGTVKHRTLHEQIRDAKAEVAAWDPDRRAAVVLQGPRHAHPPSRDCMCAACRPSFDNGADDPAQRYDIARGATLGRSDWMAEAKRLVFRLMQSANVDGAGQTPQVPVDDAKAALLDHIRTYPSQRGANG